MDRLSPLYTMRPRRATAVDGWQLGPDAAPVADLSLTDCSGDGKLRVEGDDAADLLDAVFGRAPAGNGAVVAADGIYIGRISPRRFQLLTPPSAETTVLARLSAARANRHITLTDETDGAGGIRLSGPGAAARLSTRCAVDFDPDAFPVDAVKITRLANVRGALWHLADGYRLYVGRSLTAYVWRALVNVT